MKSSIFTITFPEMLDRYPWALVFAPIVLFILAGLAHGLSEMNGRDKFLILEIVLIFVAVLAGTVPLAFA